jgi:PAS domain S-box-containing protein
MSQEIEILIVEESLPQAEQLKHILEQHAHKVSVEHDARLALAAMRERKPQIVISAVLLPEMDGYALCREIKADENLKDIPVILLTSLSDSKDIIRGLECGADNFITKPYDEDLLLSRIEYIVLNRELRLGAGTQTGLEIIFNGEKYSITPERQQMVDLLISTYEMAVHKSFRLQRAEEKLNALNEHLEEEVKIRTSELLVEVADRKRAEEKLRQNESQLAEAQRIAHVGNWSWDVQTNAVSWSDEHFRLFGLSPQEFTPSYEATLKYTHPDDRDLVTSTVENALQTHEPFSFDLRVIHPDGKMRILHSRGNVISDEQQHPISVFGTAQDVTELRQADEQLRNSEQYFRSLIENASDLITILDSSGTIRYESPSIERILGYQPEERIGQSPYSLLHPDDLLMAQRFFAEGMKHPGVALLAECRLQHKDGSWRVLETKGINLLDDPLIGVIIVNSRDITSRKQAEAALRESEERYHRFFDENLAGGYISTPDGRLLACNPAFARIFGFASCEEASEHNLDAIYPDPKAREAFLELIREKRKLERYEVELRRCDGTPVHVIENVVGVFDEHGTLVELKGSVLDTTDRKLAEQALFESEERLQQSQKMEAIGTLAGGVAHDFNNLLTAILGNTHLALRSLQPDDPLQLRLVEVEKAGNRATVLTRQLLAFSRRQHLERRTINLNDTINEIMKLLRRIIGEDVEVRVIATPGLSAIFADPAQIEQVIMNLAVNARDAMPQGGQLTIETSNIELDESYQRQYPYVSPGKYVQIMVSDTGSGMDAETQKRIFEPFFTTKEVDKGTGLGLSMVYGIVKQHDGHINVYSEVGQGTIFRIFLPVVESEVEKEGLVLQLPLRGGTETILVAEDEEALRNLARDILEGLGYKVLLAKNGEEAVAMYEQHREQIDLLLLDVVMPRMGGIAAYERIRESNGDVPLILMTGYSAATVQSRFVKQNELMEELGATVLQKPYNVEGLGRKVREVLDKVLQKQ